MIENRELNIDDYLAMLRRRMKVILIPALLTPVAAFLISYAFPAKYTSQSLIMVEEQKVPQGYVKPVITEDIAQRIATMQQQVLSRNQLQPMIERLGLAKGRNVDDVVDEIRQNVSIQAVQQALVSSTPRRPGQSDLPGFYLNYTAGNPLLAQQVCSDLTSMMLAANLKAREQVAQSTTDFLSRQLDDAKKTLDDLDSKLANFKKQYMGQLPGDEDNNMRILDALNSQLGANTQGLNRAQQDRAYAESLLAQQLSAWKATQSSTNPQTLEQQLASLQSQLISLQARYTDDYPDVIKTKADIAQVKKKIDEMNTAASKSTTTAENASLAEPPEIQQLRLQIHQYDITIGQLNQDQKRLQQQINSYQSRVALSPAVEEQYKQLTRDYDTAQKIYNDLLSKKSESEMATEMERRQQGEQMRLLNPANLPDAPSFPVRWQFAVGGLGGGLAIGMGLALWLELRDKSIRTEQDVIAVMELPMLVSLPWLGVSNDGDGGKRARRRSSSEEKEETVQV
ncbi:MAG TPA: Wzz/FepE/Etk N-terminal domain-containing protein [Terriglobales bacterium]|nr:Wzz/FepE/Etk N-terminal domain-containing protein [Terriglobales bacterium]